MADILTKELRELLTQPGTLKSIATVGKNGVPHVVYKGSLHVEEDQLVFDEILESSQNNKNLVYSLWFGKKVAVNILGSDKTSYEVIGTLEKVITCGRKFEKEYVAIQEKIPDGELSGIWYIQPESVKNVTFAVRKEEQDKTYPVLYHLDRLANDK